MEIQIFSIFDVKAGIYSQPFFSPSKGVAVRMFMELVADKSTSVAKYPADYTLFHIGHWDDSTAKMISLDTPQPLGTALEYVAAREAQQPTIPLIQAANVA